MIDEAGRPERPRIVPSRNLAVIWIPHGHRRSNILRRRGSRRRRAGPKAFGLRAEPHHGDDEGEPHRCRRLSDVSGLPRRGRRSPRPSNRPSSSPSPATTTATTARRPTLRPGSRQGSTPRRPRRSTRAASRTTTACARWCRPPAASSGSAAGSPTSTSRNLKISVWVALSSTRSLRSSASRR